MSVESFAVMDIPVVGEIALAITAIASVAVGIADLVTRRNNV